MPYFTSFGVLERVILQVLWARECAFWGGLMGCRGEAYPRKSVVQAHSYPRKSVVNERFHRAVCVAATPCSRSHSLLLEQGYANQEWMENVPLVAIDAFFDQK